MPRTLEFNPDHALQKAMTYFWQHGYEATHMRDLADYMGISKSSFYNTYGDKHQGSHRKHAGIIQLVIVGPASETAR